MSKNTETERNEEVDAEITFVHTLSPETIEKLRKRNSEQPVAQKSTKRPLFLFSAQGKTREQLARDILMALRNSSRKPATKSRKEVR